jgi:hypothetical protein
MSKLTHQVVHDLEFKASEFPIPAIWEAEEAMVEGCNIVADAPLPSHASYINCRFDGWPTFTPDPRPVRFANNYVVLMEGWVAENNVFNIGGAKAQTDMSTFILHREEGG